jgi:hypothetical protein
MEEVYREDARTQGKILAPLRLRGKMNLSNYYIDVAMYTFYKPLNKYHHDNS